MYDPYARVEGEVLGVSAMGNRQWATGNSIVVLKSIDMAAANVKETKAYKLAFELAMEIFETSRSFPKEETYSLTDQIRRSSRSVCICLLEAYRKKRYPAHFVSKITDSDMENSETSGWLDFALACKYINQQVHDKLNSKNQEIGKPLHHMINNPEKY